MVLLISLISLPVTLFIIGLILFVKPPKKINHTVGYRSANSMKSQEAWDYAQKISAKSMMIIGIFDVVIDLTVALPLFLQNNAHYEMVSLILIFVNILPLIPMLFIIEQKLFRFNSNQH